MCCYIAEGARLLCSLLFVVFFSRCFGSFVSPCQCIYFLMDSLLWPRCVACLLESSLNLGVCAGSLEQSRCLSAWCSQTDERPGWILLCICNRIQLLLLPKAEQNLQTAASGISPIRNCEGRAVSFSEDWKRKASQCLAGAHHQPAVAFPLEPG